MPVIGRLDSQVNDVLIAPVGDRRRRDKGDDRDGSDERAPRDAVDAVRSAMHGDTSRGDTEDTSDDAQDDSRGDVRRDEQLPVWLL